MAGLILIAALATVSAAAPIDRFGRSTNTSSVSSLVARAGVINTQATCPNVAVGATEQIQAESGPNGHIDFLNCGIQGSGWTPPDIKINEIIAMDLGLALQDPNTPFRPCEPYLELFKKHAATYNFPPIILAAFAMQESTCNPDPPTNPNTSEQGMMQISLDKCEGAPNGNCKDPDFNIGAGAKFFADTLNGNGGNVPLSIGKYNGWVAGLTETKAREAASGACCVCQNNLDYVHQFLNGWIQNFNVYGGSPRLGKFFNMDEAVSKSLR